MVVGFYVQITYSYALYTFVKTGEKKTKMIGLDMM
jgi:hypothetical protein